MTDSMRDKTAIVGVGVTPQAMASKVRGQPGWSTRELQIEAFKRAIADAGLQKERIDGLLTEPDWGDGPTDYLMLAQALGMNPGFGASMLCGGATGGVLIQHAARAVNAGAASYVACVYAGGARVSRPSGISNDENYAGDAIPWATWGALGPISWSAISASRHMALYGTKSEQLADPDQRPLAFGRRGLGLTWRSWPCFVCQGGASRPHSLPGPWSAGQSRRGAAVHGRGPMAWALARRLLYWKQERVERVACERSALPGDGPSETAP
ncbi:MAG: hypothetical protein HY534_00910 [Chloroflexi bacterium]|nr:hypothetical protein [Chloroflexota bacterium]